MEPIRPRPVEPLGPGLSDTPDTIHEVDMPQLQPSKPKRKSLTIQGATIAAIAAVIVFLLNTFLDVAVSTEEVVELISGAVAFVGAIIAFIGRLRATETVR